MRTLAATCLILSSATLTTACLWDYDTLREERARFPNALELITGKFIRHSKEFYQWRIEDRTKRIAQQPDNVALYDDLAVAYDKTGNQSEAIATIMAKEELKPGQYETAANLGTFHIHAGNLEEGLQHIDRAIEINPDAHFGREIYQKLLVQYVLKYRTPENAKLPLYRKHAPKSWTGNSHVYFDAERAVAIGFGQFVLEERPQANTNAEQEELQRATKGILGMMRFGHFDSPVLLEALGTLLLSDANDRDKDAKQLATRAFLKASQEADDPTAREDYKAMAWGALRGQVKSPTQTDQVSLASIERQLSTEVAAADKWFHENIERDEKTWIAKGKDVEALFDAKYRQNPSQPFEPVPLPAGVAALWVGIAIIAATLFFAVIVRFYLRRTTRRQTAAD
ncbi:MAG: hypothetical protein AB8G99_15005 [Planctomycetaceae bacterium]